MAAAAFLLCPMCHTSVPECRLALRFWVGLGVIPREAVVIVRGHREVVRGDRPGSKPAPLQLAEWSR